MGRITGLNQYRGPATSRPFQAKYLTECARCDGTIEVGEDVQFVDDELVHIDCEPDPFVAPKRSVCPKCFMELPISGDHECLN